MWHVGKSDAPYGGDMTGPLPQTLRHLAFALAVAAGIGAPQAALAIDPLVSTDWLRAHLGDPDLIVIDTRSSSAFSTGHIPRSVDGVYPDLWRNPDWSLLPVDTLEGNLSALGIANGAPIVIVPAGGDGTEFGNASFPYWVLRYLGERNVAILDGGWAAWKADASDPVESGAVASIRTAFIAHPDATIRAGTDEVAAAAGTDTVLVDARSPAQYAGKEKSGLVARAGHIPGAINVPYASFYDDANHRLRPKEALAALMPPALADESAPVIAYCNTGHWSSIDWFVLHEVLGYANTRLYDGSMAEWTKDPSRPVVTGGQPQ